MKFVRFPFLSGLLMLWLFLHPVLSMALTIERPAVSPDAGAYHFYRGTASGAVVFLAAIQPKLLPIHGDITTFVKTYRKEEDVVIDYSAKGVAPASFYLDFAGIDKEAQEEFKKQSDKEKKQFFKIVFNMSFEELETDWIIRVGDFDGDGRYEFLLIPPNSDNGQKAVIAGDLPDDGVSSKKPIDISGDMGTIIIKDVNGDGRDDIVIITPDGSKIIRHADTNGNFLPPDDNVGDGGTTLPVIAGASQGSFRVNESGSATYSMPIPMPEGIAGLTPQLGISYASQGNNGHLGIGWSLSGLSAVTRCRRTLEQDGETSATSDRFCLDGQRLVAVTGKYGANGTEYRTVIDSQTKVISYGSKSGYPTGFRVWRKDGSVSEYGMTTDAFIEAQGKRHAVAWAINKTQDSVLNNRNAITYQYKKYPEKGEYTLEQVAYAGGQTTVDFVYDDTRSDAAVFYSEGSLSSLNQRLRRIEVRNKGSLYRKIQLQYQENGVTRQSRLTGVQECSATDCFPKTTFEWGEMTQDFAPGETTQLEKGYKNGKAADINGDGREDYIAYLESGHIVSYLSDGNKLVASGQKTLLKKGLKPEDWFVLDFNADGKTDVLYRNTTWKLRLSNGSDYEHQKYGEIDTKLPAKNVTLADVDGDGLTDLLYFNEREAGSGGQDEPGRIDRQVIHEKLLAVRYLRPNTKKLSNFPYLFAAPEKLPRTFDLHYDGYFVGFHTNFGQDINGDGLVDFAIANRTDNSGDSRKHYWYLYTRKGDDETYTHIEPKLIDDRNLPQSSVPLLFVDINGDGLPDWLREDKYFLNTGEGFDQGHDLGINVIRDTDIAKSLRFIDYNGDGYQDLFYTKQSKAWVKLWNGKSFDAPIETAAKYHGRDNSLFLDLNGNGRKSYVYMEKDGKTHIQHPMEGGGAQANRIVSINNGAGNHTEIDYKPLTDKSVYTKGILAAYNRWGNGSPVFDLMAPSYVVSQVRSTAPTAGRAPGAVDPDAMSSVSYRYAGALAQGGGRGMLGFKTLTTIDDQTGVKTATTYEQQFPYTGLPESTTVYSRDGKQLSSSGTEWEAVDLGGYWQLRDGTLTDISYEPNSQKGVTVTTTYKTFDEYGSPTVIAIRTFDSVRDMISDPLNATQNKVTYNTYTNDENKWHLARLTRTIVATEEGGKASKRISSFDYDSTTGMLIAETVEPDTDNELTTTYTHDAWGNTVRSRITGKGVTARENQAVYSADGRYADRAINALGQTTSQVLARDAFGRPLQVQDSNQLVTTFAYDGMGRESSQRHANGGGQDTRLYTCATSPVACPAGGTLVIETTVLGGGKSWVIQDALGREIRQLSEGFDGTLVGRDTEYDNLSRPVRVSEPFSENSVVYWNETQYDILGRTTKVTQANGHFETFDYNRYDTTVTNSQGQTRKETRNALGQLAQVEDHLNNTIVYGYDTQGNLTRTVQTAADTDKSATTTITYDALGRKIAMDDPDKGSWSYAYDAMGHLIQQTDGKGQTQTLRYDLLDRLVARTDKRADGTVEGEARWVYDTKKVGMLSETHDSKTGFKKALTYDRYARVSEVATTFDKVTYRQKSTYDAFGRVDAQYDAAGANSGIRYHYNSRGFMTRLQDIATDRHWYQVKAMDARGNITVQDINGLTQTRVFDAETGYLDTLSTRAIGSDLQRLDYQWDMVGNLTQRQDANTSKTLTETFTYDGLNRLTSSAVGGTTDRYRYDGLGNITFKSGVGNYSYGQHGAGIHAVTYTSGDKASYRYDANGNMTSGGGRTLRYSTFDKPLSISKGGHTTAFRYDMDRSRYWRKDTSKDGKVTTTHYIGNVEVITRPNGDKETKRYINGVVIDTQTKKANGSTTGSVQLLLKDHLGSIHTIMDGNKMTVLQRQSFDPFGQRRNPTDWQALLEKDRLGFDSKLTTRGFTGHEQLDEVGLVHMNGRVYDPRLGRFLQADPFIQAASNTQSFNRYSYVQNNPLNAVDPSGYFLGKLFKGIGKLLGGFAPFVAIAAAIFLPGAGFMIAAFGKFGAAVAAGFISGGIATGTLKGAFIGAFSAAAFAGISSKFQGTNADKFGTVEHLKKTVAHGFSGGVMSVLNGGKFGHGFISAGATQLAAPGINSIGGAPDTPGYFDIGNRAGRISVAAVIGGTSSSMTGGKFANGAVTEAFLQAMNDELQQQSIDDYPAANNEVEEMLSIEGKDDLLAQRNVLGSGVEAHNGGKDHVHWGRTSNPRENAINKDNSIRHGKAPPNKIKKMINKKFKWNLKSPLMILPFSPEAIDQMVNPMPKHMRDYLETCGGVGCLV